MHLSTTLASGLFLTSQFLTTSAKVYDQDLRSTHFVTRNGDWEAQLGENAFEMLDALEKRQAPAPAPAAPAPAPPASSAPPAATPATPSGGDAAMLDLAAWDAQTRAFCQERVRALNGQVENKLGMAVCYNVPFHDNQTGVFMAELLLYNVSAPVNPWDMVGQNINLTITYAGAQTQPFRQPTPGQTTAKRDTTLSWPPIKLATRSAAVALGQLEARQAADVNEMSLQRFVGRMDESVIGQDPNKPELRELMVPSIQFTARMPTDNSPMELTLGADEPSFQNGIYKRETAAQVAPSEASQSAIAQAAKPFKVPGTTFGVPPVGFVVTMIWTVLFCGAVGFGTFGRLQFREQYRRRVKRSQVQGVKTI